MAQNEPLRVEIVGLEDLCDVVREIRRAARELGKAAAMAQEATKAAHKARAAQAVNDAAKYGHRRLCDPEVGQ